MQNNNKNNNKRILNYLPYLIVLVAVISLFTLNQPASSSTLTYDQLLGVIETEKVSESTLSIGSNVSTVKGVYEKEGKKVTFNSTLPSSEKEISTVIDKLSRSKLTIVDANASNMFLELLYSMLPLIVVVVMGIWMMNRMNGAGSANARAFDFGNPGQGSKTNPRSSLKTWPAAMRKNRRWPRLSTI